MMHPNAPYGVDPRTGLPYSEKKKLVAGLLQILVGSFAVGRFYTGHIGIACAQIAVVYLTCGVGLLWPLIDGILMLTGNPTDSEGRPLREGT
jgi:TM2 domain-containing membrane protein YozV